MKKVSMTLSMAAAALLTGTILASAGPISPTDITPLITSESATVLQVRGCHRGFRRHYEDRYDRRTRHRHRRGSCRATKESFEDIEPDDDDDEDDEPRRRRGGCVTLGGAIELCN